MSSIVQLEWVIGSRVASSFCLGEGSLLFCDLETMPVGEDSLSGEGSDRSEITDNKIRTQEQVVQIIDSALVTLISWYITNSFIEERSLRGRSIWLPLSVMLEEGQALMEEEWGVDSL